MQLQEELIAKLKEYKPSLKDTAITNDTTFDSLGFDSLDSMELLMAIEHQYNITLPEDQQIFTLGELTKTIQGLVK